MRIQRLEVVPYALPFKEPYVTARGRLEQRELVLLQAHTSDLVGLGEAAPLSLRGGTDGAEVAAELERRCAPILEGAALEAGFVERLLNRCAAVAISRQSLAAVELALLDLRGKLEGQPVWRLLGAEKAHAVECNATLVAGEPSAVATRATSWAKRGFTTFKLKAGVPGDVDQIRAVREALGDQARIRIDANGAWTVDEAVTKLRELEPLGIQIAEQPVATIEGMAVVRGRVGIPLAADESVTTVEEAEAAAKAGCDAATVKIAKVGGVTPGQRIASVLPTYLSSALDGPVGIAAAVHLAQTLPARGLASELAHGLATGELFADTIAASAYAVKDAAISPSDAPGFAVEIDEPALERLRRG